MIYHAPDVDVFGNYIEPEPAVACAEKDCGEAAYREEDMGRCDGCDKPFCADHLYAVDDLKLCGPCVRTMDDPDDLPAEAYDPRDAEDRS